MKARYESSGKKHTQKSFNNHTPERIKKSLPGIDNLKLSKQNWQDLTDYLDQNYPNKRLYQHHILLGLEQITKIDYDELLRMLSNRADAYKRDARPKRKAENEVSDKKPSKRRRTQKNGINHLVYDPNQTDSSFASPLEAAGVQRKTLMPRTPEHGYTQLHVSPGGGKYRPYWDNKNITLFKQQTPAGTKLDGGRAQFKRPARKALFNDRAKPTCFTATLDKIEQQRNKKRRCSQRTLTGKSCIEVFKQEGLEPVAVSGKDFHWGHMIAHFLGGAQNKANLVPSTAAANYNVLDMVERPIAARLSAKKPDGTPLVKSIDIKVTPVYVDKQIIPTELIFELSWQENKQAKKETFYIIPSSFQRVTDSMLYSMDVARDMESDNSSLELGTEQPPSSDLPFV